MFESETAAIGPALARQLAGLLLSGLDEDGLIGALAAAERLARWATAAQLAVISELAARRGDAQFVADEVAAELRLSRVAAATRVGLALDQDNLPVLRAGMVGGRPAGHPHPDRRWDGRAMGAFAGRCRRPGLHRPGCHRPGRCKPRRPTHR